MKLAHPGFKSSLLPPPDPQTYNRVLPPRPLPQRSKRTPVFSFLKGACYSFFPLRNDTFGFFLSISHCCCLPSGTIFPCLKNQVAAPWSPLFFFFHYSTMQGKKNNFSSTFVPPWLRPAVIKDGLSLLMLVCYLVLSDSLRPHGQQPHQALLFMGFSRREYWSRLPFPSPGGLLDPGIKHASLALQVDSLLLCII